MYGVLHGLHGFTLIMLENENFESAFHWYSTLYYSATLYYVCSSPRSSNAVPEIEFWDCWLVQVSWSAVKRSLMLRWSLVQVSRFSCTSRRRWCPYRVVAIGIFRPRLDLTAVMWLGPRPEYLPISLWNYCGYRRLFLLFRGVTLKSQSWTIQVQAKVKWVVS